MNILIETPVVLYAVSTAAMYGVDIRHYATKACITESFSENEAKDILKWSAKN